MSDNEEHISAHEEQTSDGRIIGRDPTQISKDELTFLGLRQMDLIDVIRERCIDCKIEHKPRITEAIRECRARECAAWPYRMGINPFVKAKSKKVEVKKKVRIKNKTWYYS
jgi:hypothetical protein